MFSWLRNFGRFALLAAAACMLAPRSNAQPAVLTFHNDNARTGQNLQETVLTPANVNASTFARLFTILVDGKVDAQPLYVPHLVIPGQGTHNVLYVATEHDTMYAFDADTGALLKSVTLLATAETPSDVRNCASQVTPEIGVTATPAIDLNIGPHGTIYVVSMSKDSAANYHHRIHALDLTTLAEQFNGPREVIATYPGTGVETTFVPKQHKERSALLISGGIVYTSWSSHCDITPYSAWIIGYSEATLAQTVTFNLEPNGNYGGMWSAGSGPQADAAGNIYVPTGNGLFDTTLLGNGFPSKGDFGNSYVKMSRSGGTMVVGDYFTMVGTNEESNRDADLGSGGGMLLPPLPDANGQMRDLAVVAGKDASIYVMDRNNLGKYNPTSNEIYQNMAGALAGGVWASPAWFNGTLYYGARGNVLKAFKFQNGLFGTNPASQSSKSFNYPGTTPSISANGTSNGIVWAMEDTNPAVLHAYDASDLGIELYNSNQVVTDHLGAGAKFIVPTIANGKVYAPTNNNSLTLPGAVGVFGLKAGGTQPPPPPPPPTLARVSVTPNSGSGTSQTFAFAFSDSNGAADIASAQMDINATLAASQACYLYYVKASNTVYLANDAGAWQGPRTLGVAGTLQNSQCAVNAASSSSSTSGNNLTVNLAITFTSGFTGAKNIYAEVRNATIDSGWASEGSWTVPASAPGPPAAPAQVSVTPSAGSGASQTFAFLFSDANGAADIASAQIDINATLAVNGACYLFYVRAPNAIYLASNTGVWQGPLTLGSPGTLQNSQCSVNTANSSATPSGNNLALNLALSFSQAFTGAKNVYMEVRDASTDAGWTTEGTWTVPGGVSATPAQVSVTPSSGSGSSQTFTFVYSDTGGALDISSAQMDINATLSATNACYLFYVHASSSIYLASDAGVWQGPLALGSPGILQNSQCSVNAATSSASSVVNNLTVNLALTFKPAFAGAKNVYMEARNAMIDTGWAMKGTWTTQ